MLVGTVAAGLVLTFALGVLAGAALADYLYPGVAGWWPYRRTVYVTAGTVTSLALLALVIQASLL